MVINLIVEFYVFILDIETVVFWKAGLWRNTWCIEFELTFCKLEWDKFGVIMLLLKSAIIYSVYKSIAIKPLSYSYQK